MAAHGAFSVMAGQARGDVVILCNTLLASLVAHHYVGTRVQIPSEAFKSFTIKTYSTLLCVVVSSDWHVALTVLTE